MIDESYLYAMALLSEGVPEGPQLAIGLRLSEKLSPQDERELCDGLSPAAPPPGSGCEGLLVTVLRNDEDLENIRKHVAPLYRRGDPPHAWILQRMLFLPRTEQSELPREPGLHQVSGSVGLLVIPHAGVCSLPAFTSEAEFTRWRPEGGEWIAPPARGLLEAFLRIQADRIVVDNKSQHAFAIDRGQAQALLELAATLPPDTLRSAVIPANDAPQ
ncbi:MAG: SseB family protein [Solirubrobacteraceae bacterium]